MTGPDEPTTRGDFPGGFPGDKRNAFSRSGRSQEEEDLFQFIRKLTLLRTELEPLRRGALVNLFVSEQQYAYARTLRQSALVVVINNDKKRAEIEFDVSAAGIPDNARLTDRLATAKESRVMAGKVKVSLPERSVAILVRQ
jgi:glycosidase